MGPATGADAEAPRRTSNPPSGQGRPGLRLRMQMADRDGPNRRAAAVGAAGLGWACVGRSWRGAAELPEGAMGPGASRGHGETAGHLRHVMA